MKFGMKNNVSKRSKNIVIRVNSRYKFLGEEVYSSFQDLRVSVARL